MKVFLIENKNIIVAQIEVPCPGGASIVIPTLKESGDDFKQYHWVAISKDHKFGIAELRKPKRKRK